MLVRTCTKCQIIKPLTEFSRDPKGRDGFAARCKKCKYAQQKNSVRPLDGPRIDEKKFKLSLTKKRSGRTSNQIMSPQDSSTLGFVTHEVSGESALVPHQFHGKTSQKDPEHLLATVITEDLEKLYGHPTVRESPSLHALSEKFANCFWHLSVKGEKAVLQIHRDPVLTFKGGIAEVLEKALSQ